VVNDPVSGVVAPTVAPFIVPFEIVGVLTVGDVKVLLVSVCVASSVTMSADRAVSDTVAVPDNVMAVLELLDFMTVRERVVPDDV
jgi:hypothetical protein